MEQRGKQRRRAFDMAALETLDSQIVNERRNPASVGICRGLGRISAAAPFADGRLDIG